MAKQNDQSTDAELKQVEDEYAKTGQVPEGWVLDPVSESRGGPRFRKADAETTPAPAEPEAESDEG